jgi:hypothetical protein
MEEKIIMDIYHNYIQAFEKKEYDTINHLCRTPFFGTSPSGTIVFNNSEELLSGFTLLRESLDADDYVQSRLNNLTFSKISDHTSNLLVDFDRINSKGQAYHNGQAMYIFHNIGGKTIISGVIVLDENTVSFWTD